MMIFIKILLLIIFIFGIIISKGKCIETFKIIFSRASEEDYVKLNNKTYDISFRSKIFLIPSCLIFCCSLLSLAFIVRIFTYSGNVENYITALSLLLPLNYNFTISDYENRCIKKFISKNLSIEELKSFNNHIECQNKLKELKQYLSKNTAEELNDFYFDRMDKPRDEEIFRDKRSQIEFEKYKAENSNKPTQN